MSIAVQTTRSAKTKCTRFSSAKSRTTRASVAKRYWKASTAAHAFDLSGMRFLDSTTL